MLLLTRKPNQSIHIGDDIVVVIIDIKGGQVKLGVEAPKETKVWRNEIYARIQKENERKVLRALERDLGAAST